MPNTVDYPQSMCPAVLKFQNVIAQHIEKLARKMAEMDFSDG